MGHFKCFTYVTKTCDNLTTYSRKPENYNGTIIFEIDIMKNSSPINLNVCQTWLLHKFLVVSFVLIYSVTLRSWAESAVSTAELEVLFWFSKRQKMGILNWVGVSFSWNQSKKNGAIVSPMFSTLCAVVKFARVLVTYMKNLQFWPSKMRRALSFMPEEPQRLKETNVEPKLKSC